MSAERNEDIEGVDFLANTIKNDFENITDGSGAGIVGDYQQNPFAGIIISCEKLRDCFAGFFVSDTCVFVLSFNYHCQGLYFFQGGFSGR